MRPPIRVLQLGSPNGLYGAERWIIALVRHLLPAQVESVIGAIADDGTSAVGSVPLCARAVELGFEAKVFPSRGKLSLSAINGLRDYIRDEHINVLHTHGYKTDIAGLLAVRGTSCRILSTPHGWNPREGWKLQVYEGVDRIALYGMDAVAPLSQQLYDGLAKLPGMKRKLHLIRNGVDLSEIDEESQRSSATEAWKTPGDFVVGYVGRLAPLKRVDTLIRAFAALGIQNKRLCIVGEGSERGKLESLAAQLGERERVRFFGYRDDRIALLRDVDVFVLPSATEGIPRCLLEAMAVGVPVMATDIPGCRLLVEDGVTGVLFEVGQHEELMRKLTDLWGDPRRREALATAGREFIRRNYSAEAMAVKYAELYTKMLGRRDATHRACVSAN